MFVSDICQIQTRENHSNMHVLASLVCLKDEINFSLILDVLLKLFFIVVTNFKNSKQYKISIKKKKKPYIYVCIYLLQGYELGVYTVWFGRFWRGFLHHGNRVQFHPMLNCTSLLKDKNRSTQGAINLSGSVWFVWLYRLDF